MKDLTHLRVEYRQSQLDDDTAPDNPFPLFEQWLAAALASTMREPYAMTLATSSPDGMPSARIVLLRQFDNSGLVFYTNYNSAKGQQLRTNPQAAALFYWEALERQVRVQGSVTPLSDTENQAYFSQRPHANQLAALASPQSQPIPSRDWLAARLAHYQTQYPSDSTVPCPAHWGGFRLMPSYFEFWQGRASRLHDRLAYRLQPTGQWQRERLAP